MIGGVDWMSAARIKTIVISALVLVNAFFLTIILIDNYAQARDERQMIESVCSILQSSGIEISPDNIITSGALRTMRTARGGEVEAAIAYAFLGRVDMTDQGTIYQYENPERGVADFYSAGDFVIQLREGVITATDSALKTTKDLLRDMRLETSAPVISANTEGEMVSVDSVYRGASIFNYPIEFYFVRNSLRTIKGRYVAGVELMEDGAEISQVGTALLRFLSAVKSGDIECKEILSVESGYQHSVVGSFGEGILAPSWLITTGDGRFLVDSATGEIRGI